MTTVNLPIALFTVVVRRFVDKLRAPQGAVVLRGTRWLMDPSLFKTCMYAYMLSAGLYYALKNMGRGTIVSLVKKCSRGALGIKNKCVRNKWLTHRNTWALQNLLKHRRNDLILALREKPKKLRKSQTSVKPNSLFTFSERNTFDQIAPTILPVDTILEPKTVHRRIDTCSDVVGESPKVERRNISGRPKLARTGVLSRLDLSEDTAATTKANRNVNTRKLRFRNCYTLRGRKVSRDQLKCDGKIVRKTRSGKVYGYHCTKSRSCNYNRQ